MPIPRTERPLDAGLVRLVTRTPLVPNDLLLLALPSDPQIAPSGRVFFVLATHLEGANEMHTAIWSAVRDGVPLPFTTGRKDRMPRISPDGALLAFVGERDEGKRVYLMPTGGGEARAISPAYDAIAALEWSPDGARLVLSATAPFDPETAAIAFDERSGARHIRALPFKSDDEGLLDGRRRHLFIIALDDALPVRVTHGDFDADAPAWSPTGDELAFVAKIGLAEAWLAEDLFVVAVAGGEPRRLTRSRGPALAPAWSNDGREIAFIGHEFGDDLGGLHNPELRVIARDGGEPRSLSATLDRPVIDFLTSDTRSTGGVQTPIWAADDREVYALVASAGTCGIAAFDRDGAAIREIAVGERDIFAFARGADGTIAFGYATPTVPSEIALLAADGSEHVVTDCNPWLAERTLRTPRLVHPEAALGPALDLWLLEPDATAPYVLQVHGGPHMAYGWTFMFEFQMIASHGIGVAYGNPRGGQTYGQAFAAAIAGDWGGVDASDVLCLLDGALEHARVDPDRVALAGGSYGGFMTTWLLGHSKRFAAGISMRAVNDFVSEVGATDAGWFLETELEAPWVDGGRRLFEMSPMRSAHAIEVPLLIEHSERDYRCAVDQGEQLFTLLRRLGRTNVEFVRFTGDGHGLSRSGKPRNRILRLRAIAHWLMRHLRPPGYEAAPDHAGSLFAPLPTETSLAK